MEKEIFYTIPYIHLDRVGLAIRLGPHSRTGPQGGPGPFGGKLYKNKNSKIINWIVKTWNYIQIKCKNFKLYNFRDAINLEI